MDLSNQAYIMSDSAKEVEWQRQIEEALSIVAMQHGKEQLLAHAARARTSPIKQNRHGESGGQRGGEAGGKRGTESEGEEDLVLYTYVKLRCVRLVGIALWVYIAKHLQEHVVDVASLTCPTGILYMLVC